MNDSCISLLYVHSRSIGYGRLGVDLAGEIAKQGITIFDHLPTPDGSGETADLWDGRLSGTSKTVCWLSTPTHAEGWWKGQTPHIFTMWEATRLPEQFRQHLHNFETCIVPSQQNVELFSDYHPNVQICPLGIDPDRWRFTPRRMPTTSFRFLLGGSGARKGGDLGRKAFRLAFPKAPEGGPMPTLVLKSPKGEETYGGPGVEIVSGRLSDEDEVALYESAHCYLQPSRGEGFGLQPLQAMAQGIPTILTDAHGHAGFAYLGRPISARLVPSAYFIYGDAGDWWEPSLDELVEQMRYVYENYEAACQEASISAQVIASDWTWKRSADTFLDIVGRENLTEIVPTTADDRWVRPKMKRYLTILNQDWTADMGGTFHIFKKGQEYWETADVKRILFEGGMLDPRCLVTAADGSIEDIGLDEEQAAKIADYTAACAHCPTCGQQVNTLPTKSDEIFAQLEAEAAAR